MTSFDITSKLHQWASSYRLSLKDDDPRFSHSVVYIKKDGTTVWFDNAFVIRIQGSVCIFSRDLCCIYNPSDLELCREVIEVETE